MASIPSSLIGLLVAAPSATTPNRTHRIGRLLRCHQNAHSNGGKEIHSGEVNNEARRRLAERVTDRLGHCGALSMSTVSQTDNTTSRSLQLFRTSKPCWWAETAELVGSANDRPLWDPFLIIPRMIMAVSPSESVAMRGSRSSRAVARADYSQHP